MSSALPRAKKTECPKNNNKAASDRFVVLLAFFFFFSFDADAIFAKISSANDLLTKYLVEDNVTRGDKDWMNIQNAMYIQYFFPLHYT